MASYGEYAPAMSAPDFDLYPSQPEYPGYLPIASQSYMPLSSYAEGPYGVAMPTPDSYSHTHTAAPPNVSRMQEFQYNFDAAAQNMKNGYRYTPAVSPAHSASNLFEMAPPQLSAASDSGASAQSTSSSAMGSPPSNSQVYHEPWNAFDALGLAPSIVHQDSFSQDTFAASGTEHDSVTAFDKLPGYVGESPIVSSSSQQSRLPIAASSSTSEQSMLSYSLSSHTATVGACGPPSAPQRQASLRQPSPATTSRFKSPSMAASVMLPPFTPSAHVQEQLRRSASAYETSASRRNPTASNRAKPPVLSSDDPASSCQSSPDTHHSPIFAQSSGHFVPPLESSCRFLCPYPISSLASFL